MKEMSIICLVLVCAIGFSEERVTPQQGSFGFISVIQTPTDADAYLPGNQWYVSPGMGIGFHYHPIDWLMLEASGFFSYDRILYDSGTTEQFMQAKLGVGVFYWANLDDSFSIFAGPKVFTYVDWSLGFPRSIPRSQVGVLFGLEHSFSKHFAIFSDFGLGFFWMRPSGDGTDNWYFRVILPEVGVTFYF